MRNPIQKAAAALLLAAASVSCLQAAELPADTVLLNGKVYTVDEHDSVRQALAIRDGKIVFVGDSAGAKALAGPSTKTVDLGGRLVLPGLIDGHMHPLEGGGVLLKCNLNYERLTIPQFQAKVQACLDKTKGQEPDQWLEVVSWFREAMIPNDAPTTRETLDALKTKRPILVVSSFGHTALVNSRALELAKIDAKTPDPQGGKITHDASGRPNGVLEDAAYAPVSALLPAPSAADDVKAAEAALEAIAKQGVTTFLDAAAVQRDMAAFAGAEKAGKLTARAHFAVLIDPPEAVDPVKAVARVKALAAQYDQKGQGANPSLTVRNVKLFLDGVISAPAMTGAMLEPYRLNKGTASSPNWQPGPSRGPDVYFPAKQLAPLLLEVAKAGFEPHMHADGDRAVREGLDGIEAMRRTYPGSKIRAALAHNEIVNPADYPRYKKLDAIPVLSMQWEKRAPDTVDAAEDYIGPERYKYMEPAGFLSAAGARVAYGSDWPVDKLDEWFALKVGVTRQNAPDLGPKYQGRLGEDPGISVPLAIRAITANAAYELHVEDRVGSLEVGKLADLIVVDRDVTSGSPADIAKTQVLLTLVGGKTVHHAAPFAP